MQLDYVDFRITKNFHICEFHCNDGTRVPHQYVANAVYVAYQLERLRELLGNCRITIISAYRTELYNLSKGGVNKSNHLTASAVDIATQKYTAEELYKKIKSYILEGFLPDGEVIRYSSFVHYAPNFQLKYLTINEL